MDLKICSKCGSEMTYSYWHRYWICPECDHKEYED
jgi:DNA-directed RNA polymerase subunit RPC12/RpoP